MKNPSKPSSRETLAAVAVLVLLCLTAGAVLFLQGRFDADLFQPPVPEKPAVKAAGPALSPEAGRYFTKLPVNGPVSVFGPDTLSDKINGKAPLYLDAGFRFLASAWVGMGDGVPPAEVFVYAMAGPEAAWSVYSTQRRENARPLPFYQKGYLTENALFLARGPYYLEAVGGDGSQATQTELARLARTFLDTVSAPEEGSVVRDPLPALGRVPDTAALIAANAFGFSGLTKVNTAEYEVDGKTALLFASKQESPEEARSLAAEYEAFLENYGGEAAGLATEIPGARAVSLYGTLEIVFSVGDFVAGVHEAPDPETAVKLANLLYRHIEETNGG